MSRAPFRAADRLTVRQVAASSITLRSRHGLMQLSVLTDDLFRLRVTRAKEFSTTPSWAMAANPAVVKAGAPQIRTTQSLAMAQTGGGLLRVRLSDGAWELQGAKGRALFSSPAGTTGFDGAKARVTLALKDGESLFGLGETTGTFNKRGLIREFWNNDILCHASMMHPSLRALYVSIPFAISLRSGHAAGLFWDNPARQTWDMGQTDLDHWKLSAASGEIDLYLFSGPSAPAIVTRYTELTGRMPLPPRWALGYQQSRYSYKTRARVEEVARTFRRKKIPCDVVYLDIHHQHGYRVFTFARAFPRPEEMVAKLKRQGFKAVTIVDPGVKDDAKFGVLQRGRKGQHFVKAPKGRKDIIGKVWPGPARFPDFLNAKARRWWGEEQAAFQKLGVAGFWNDMNEPAIFDLSEKTLPEKCVHQTDYGKQLHASVQNLYGMQMARASYEGALAHTPNQRPFIITRSGYAGTQRYALIWTGDNSSTWEHLADSVPMLLNLSLSGVPFCGADAGGFLDSATGELLTRWTQLAAFTPFFRNHSNIESRDQEPWAFGPRVEAICRHSIELRYRLLPYLYCLFAEAHRHGTPIMRPMMWQYQGDPKAVAAGDQFMLGPDLLVAPILRQGAMARSVYLPRGTWHDYHTGKQFDGGQHVLAEAPLENIPLFVRGGAIIPMAPVQQFVGEKSIDTIVLHAWMGGNGTLNWYEDDGVTQEHQAGVFTERVIRFIGGAGKAALSLGKPTGAYVSAIKRWRVMVHGAEQSLRLKVNGQRIRGRLNKARRTFEFEIENQNKKPMEIG